MPAPLSISQSLIIHELENDMFLAEGVGVPTFVKIGDNEQTLVRNLNETLVHHLESLAPHDIHPHHIGSEMELTLLSFEHRPHRRSKRIEAPIPLRFSVVTFNLGEQIGAYVPALQLYLAVKDRNMLQTRLINEIRYMLRRFHFSDDLFALQRLQQAVDTHLTTTELSLNYLSPTAREKQNLTGETPKKVVPKVARLLATSGGACAFEMDDIIKKLAHHLAPPKSSSVLLVGPSGIGKSAVIRELARNRKHRGLTCTEIWSTNGARLVAGQSGFGQWQEQTGRFLEEVKAEGHIIHIGRLFELLEVGQSTSQTQSIADLFKPYIARQDVVVIAECTPSELSALERRDAHLISLFEQVEISPLIREQVSNILISSASALEQQHHTTINVEAVEEIERLHHLFARYATPPGGPIKFLSTLMMNREHDSDIPVDENEIRHCFAARTGLPLFLLDENTPFDAEQTRQWFLKGLKGQDGAVDLVVSLIATIKSRLMRPEKPLCTFLFAGPTGVGKTELAKLLARFLFSNPDHMTRFDMSEFSDPVSVERLIGGMGDEGMLTAKVRERPFSVILFDELEKADARFFDFLLQILGEGRLTDRAGRLADFTSSVVIMTSNIGAHIFSRQEVGFGSRGASNPHTERLMGEIRDFFRPELLNRIDRVVPFSPLSIDCVTDITQHLIAALNKRDGIREGGIHLKYDASLAAHLAKAGFDPALGARPIRRTIDRQILAPLADKLAGHKTHQGIETRIQPTTPLTVTLSPPKGAQKQAPQFNTEHGQIQETRRRAQALMRGFFLKELKDDIFRLKKQVISLQKRLRRHPHLGAKIEQLHAQIEKKSAVVTQIQTTYQTICNLENASIKQYILGTQEDLPKESKHLTDIWRNACFALYQERFENPNRINLGIFSDHADLTRQLGLAYHHYLTRQGTHISVQYWTMEPDKKTSKTIPVPHEITDMSAFLTQSDIRFVGLSFHATHPGIYLKLHKEIGLHQFKAKDRPKAYLNVYTSDVAMVDFIPPAHLLTRVIQKQTHPRREYDLTGTIKDKALGETRHFNGDDFSSTLLQLIDAELIMRVEREVTQ